MQTTINDYLFDSDVIPFNERIALSEVINAHINLQARVTGYMHVYTDVVVNGADGIKFDSDAPEKDAVKKRWYQLIAKLDEVQEFILNKLNQFLPVTCIKLPENAIDPRYTFDKDGHVILVYCMDDHPQSQINFDDVIEISN